MSKENDFSIAMSVLLLQIRGEELLGEKLLVDSDDVNCTSRFVESEYIDNVLNNEEDCTLIKNSLRLSILNTIRDNPRFCYVPSLFSKEKGHYEYHPDLMEFTSIVDDYIIMKWKLDNPTFKDVFICKNCGSPHVQIKTWVYANTEKVVETIDDSVGEDNYCDDCVGYVDIEKVSKNVLHKIIGYQVVNTEDETDDVHPAYDDNKFSSLWFARDILDKLNDDRFGLKTIWTDTLECPNYVKHS